MRFIGTLVLFGGRKHLPDQHSIGSIIALRPTTVILPENGSCSFGRIIGEVSFAFTDPPAPPAAKDS